MAKPKPTRKQRNQQEIPPNRYLGSLCARGHDYKGTGRSLRRLTGHCTECANVSSRKHYRVPGNRKRHFENCRKWMNKDRKRRPVKHLVQAAKSRARRKGLPFDIDEDYMLDQLEKQGHKCYWLGVPIAVSVDRYGLDKATLERLDPQAGYTQGNVVWACSFANLGRVNSTPKEFRRFLRTVMEANSG